MLRTKTIFSGLVLTTWDNDGCPKKYHWNHNEPKYGTWVLYDGSYNEVKTIQTINENNLGIQNIVYEIKNTNNDIKQNIREVHVVDICCIFFNQENYYDISNLSEKDEYDYYIINNYIKDHKYKVVTYLFLIIICKI